MPTMCLPLQSAPREMFPRHTLSIPPTPTTFVSALTSTHCGAVPSSRQTRVTTAVYGRESPSILPFLRLVMHYPPQVHHFSVAIPATRLLGILSRLVEMAPMPIRGTVVVPTPPTIVSRIRTSAPRKRNIPLPARAQTATPRPQKLVSLRSVLPRHFLARHGMFSRLPTSPPAIPLLLTKSALWE